MVQDTTGLNSTEKKLIGGFSLMNGALATGYCLIRGSLETEAHTSDLWYFGSVFAGLGGAYVGLLQGTAFALVNNFVRTKVPILYDLYDKHVDRKLLYEKSKQSELEDRAQ